MSRGEAWTYSNPVTVLFGAGRLVELPSLVHGRTLLVTTAGSTARGLTTRVRALVGDDRVVVLDSVESNPDVDAVDRSIQDLKSDRFDTVVGVGGGSSIDYAKALSLGLADHTVSIREALATETVPMIEPVDVIAVPTTAGTGSEVTPFATIWDRTSRRKKSLTSPRLFPRAAILDSDLTLTLPWDETLSTGLDAYAQCYESIWSKGATPVTIALAEHGLRTIPPALRHLKRQAHVRDARNDMLRASLCSGLAIAQTRTALAHSISYPLTAHFGLPHGFACALTLPAVLRFNLEADDGRFEALATRLGAGNTQQLARDMTVLFRDLGVSTSISARLPDPSQVETLVAEMLTPGRADNGMRAADSADVLRIVRTSLESLARDFPDAAIDNRS